MAKAAPNFKGMSLFTDGGERKYLSESERAQFINALPVLPDPRDQSFCSMLYWTGCRPSEALGLTAMNIDLVKQMVIIRTLKKRGAQKGRHFRPVPVPSEFTAELDRVHGVRAARSQRDGGESMRLWPFSRTTAWHRVRTLMDAAGLTGVKACAKGLRHAYYAQCEMREIPESRIKKWLGHESVETTEIYLDVAGPEDRAIAAKLWRDTDFITTTTTHEEFA